MIIRIWNNDGNEYCDYEAETIEEIREMWQGKNTVTNLEKWLFRNNRGEIKSE